MIPWHHVQVGVGIGLAVNLVASWIWSHKLYTNVPKFCLNLGVCVQLVVLPVCTLRAWGDGYAAHGSTVAWLFSDWSAPKVWEQRFVVALVASMTKDMPWIIKYRTAPPGMGNLMIAHHVGCATILLWCLSAETRTASLFIVSTTWLEIGSAMSSLTEFYPTSKNMLRVFFWVMTSSNIQCILAMVWPVVEGVPQSPWSLVMMLTGIITIYFRQVVAHEYRDSFARTGSTIPISPESSIAMTPIGKVSTD